MRTSGGSTFWSALLLLLPALFLLLVASGCGPGDPEPAAASTDLPVSGARVTASSPVEAGRYLVLVGGCNDCHTDGFLVDPESVPESEWLKGSIVGFRGPWGTTYPKNLRVSAASMTEDQWVARLQAGGLPPMPWYNVGRMAEGDARAVYRYIRSLGETGVAAPLPVGPGVEPATPWIDFVPRAPGTHPAQRPS